MEPLAREILSFWFGTTDLSVEVVPRQIWFRSTPEFDGYLSRTYTGVHERAAAGALDHFKDTPEDCLSLIIVLDQFPRNIYRGTARAYASDAKAREIAKHALARGYERNFHTRPRLFVYLPFEHSEILADQERGLELYRALNDERSLNSATAHHDAIRRFGRFPHRNAVMGRKNTPEEEEYLKDPPLWGKTAAEVAEAERRTAAREDDGGQAVIDPDGAKPGPANT